MTNEQINQAIAEILQWKRHDNDFCRDLNAMHHAEKVLQELYDMEVYGNIVADLVHAKNRDSENPKPWQFARIHATARQRAEAFLKTLGKWEEARP